ncbi:Uncharacterised protein [Mycobacteroides abscessus subsp. massiliense]|nr:Uncharacterised protein [Mycobacteroides abscessus subsp. massiliense]
MLWGDPWAGDVEHSSGVRCEECGAQNLYGIDALQFPVHILANVRWTYGEERQGFRLMDTKLTHTTNATVPRGGDGEKISVSVPQKSLSKEEAR